MKNTNWTTPKRNIFAALNDLRHALAAGQNARLIRARNEDCQHPIKVKNSITDFRAYEFSVGLLKTRKQIVIDPDMPEFLKYLSLNYKACYGTQQAVDRYYNTGKLSKDNFKGIGRSHLVKVEDLIAFHACLPDKFSKDYAQMFKAQYLDDTRADETHFYDMYRLKREHSIYTISRFKRKVWVVELLRPDQKIKTSWLMLTSIGLLNAIMYPLKFIPTKSVLRMDEYKCVTFRIGAVTSGLAIEFHIPKKFSFK